MITLTFANGLKLENLRLNGNNYVSETEIDTSVFTPEAMQEMTEHNSETEMDFTFHDVVFVQQTRYSDGWYLCFREKSQQEKIQELMTNAAVSAQYAQCKWDGIKYVAEPENPIPLVMPMHVIRNMIYLYNGVRYVALKDGTATEAEFDNYFAEY